MNRAVSWPIPAKRTDSLMESSLSGEIPVGDGNLPSSALATSVSQAITDGVIVSKEATKITKAILIETLTMVYRQCIYSRI